MLSYLPKSTSSVQVSYLGLSASLIAGAIPVHQTTVLVKHAQNSQNSIA